MLNLIEVLDANSLGGIILSFVIGVLWALGNFKHKIHRHSKCASIIINTLFFALVSVEVHEYDLANFILAGGAIFVYTRAVLQVSKKTWFYENKTHYSRRANDKVT